MMEDLSPFWIGVLGFTIGFVAGCLIVIVGLALESIRRSGDDEQAEHQSFDPRKPWKRRK